MSNNKNWPDSETLQLILRESATKTVDHDLRGNPITDADSLLWSAYRPLLLRFGEAMAHYGAEREREKVREIQLATVKATVEAIITWSTELNCSEEGVAEIKYVLENIDAKSIIEQVKI